MFYTPLFSLFAVVSLNFFQLSDGFESYVGQEVSIKGYVYTLEDGVQILSPLAKMRTCCVKNANHIFIDGKKVPEGGPVEIFGRLEKGEEPYRYKIELASTVN